jgi:hypothetical protein
MSARKLPKPPTPAQKTRNSKARDLRYSVCAAVALHAHNQQPGTLFTIMSSIQ